MITIDEAKEFLNGQGLEATDFVLTEWLALINSKAECLNGKAGAKLAALALLTMLAMTSAYRYISSQSAPSGASRSFAIRDFSGAWNANLATIQQYDKDGCLWELIPQNPEPRKSGAIFTARGCRL